MAEKGLGLEISEFSRNRLKEHEEPRKTGKKCHCGGDIVLVRYSSPVQPLVAAGVGRQLPLHMQWTISQVTDCFCGACGLIYNPAVLGVS